jgi:hypothetical protein
MKLYDGRPLGSGGVDGKPCAGLLQMILGAAAAVWHVQPASVSWDSVGPFALAGATIPPAKKTAPTRVSNVAAPRHRVLAFIVAPFRRVPGPARRSGLMTANAPVRPSNATALRRFLLVLVIVPPLVMCR